MDKITYNTKQKQYIFDVLERNSSKSLSGAKILDIFSLENKKVSKATLYRFLDNLVFDGCVRKFYNEEVKSFEYQLLSETKKCNEHLHLRCEICGKITHLDCDDAISFTEHILKEHGFNIIEKDSIICGICDDCRKKG